VASLEILVLFVLVPLGAAVIGVAILRAAFSDLPTREPPAAPTRGPAPAGAFMNAAAILALPILFGGILWTLGNSSAQAVDADPAAWTPVGDLLWGMGIAFAFASVVTVATQVGFLRVRMREFVGAGFGRLLPFVVIPTEIAIFALILMFLGLGLAVEVLSGNATLTEAQAADAVLGYRAFAISTLAAPLAIWIANRTPNLAGEGFGLGMLVAGVGELPMILVFAWAYIQLPL